MNYDDELKAYVDGELPPEAMAAVEERLRADPRLRAEADALRRLSDQIRSMARQPEVAGQDEVLRTLRARAPARGGRWMQPFALAAAAVLIGVFAVQLLRHPEAIGRLEGNASLESVGKEMARSPAQGPASPSAGWDEADRSGVDEARPSGPGVERARRDSQRKEPPHGGRPAVGDTTQAPSAGDGRVKRRTETRSAPDAKAAVPAQAPGAKPDNAARRPNPSSELGAEPAEDIAPRPALPGGAGGGGWAGRAGAQGSASAPVPASQGPVRPIVARTMDIALASPDLKGSQARLASLVQELGLSPEFAVRGDAKATSDRLVLRVPHARLSEFIAKLDLVGSLKERTTSDEDLTAEYARLDAEFRELDRQQQAMEEQAAAQRDQGKKQEAELVSRQRRIGEIGRRLAAIEERAGYVLVEIRLVPGK